MKKKQVLLLIFGISALMFVQPMQTFATTPEIKEAVQISWKDYLFEGYPTPDFNFVNANGFSIEDNAVSKDDGYKGFTLASNLEGSYKILSYDPETNLVYSSSVGTSKVEADEEFGIEAHSYNFNTLEANDDASRLGNILLSEPVRSANDYVKICNNKEGYVLFFEENTTSPDGVVFVCKIADLGSYLDDSEPRVHKSWSAKSEVTILDTNPTSGSATLKVDFNLGMCYQAGDYIAEDALSIVIDKKYNVSLGNKNEGSVTFELNGLENKVYDYYIVGSMGYDYVGSFEVDFVTAKDDSMDTSVEQPIVVIDGLNSEKQSVGTPVTLKMSTSNVKSKMSVGGVLLGNGIYGKSYEFTVDHNGIYQYIATTALGQVTEGYFEVNFFEGTYTGTNPNAETVPLND